MSTLTPAQLGVQRKNQRRFERFLAELDAMAGQAKSEPTAPFVEPPKPYIKDGHYVCQETHIPKFFNIKMGGKNGTYS